MRRQHFLFLLLLFLPLPAQAAFELLDVGARPAAMAGAFCAVADDAHGPRYNPAGMSWSPGRRVALSACRLFGLAELDIQEAAYLEHFPWCALGFRAQHLGGDLYRETSVELSGSRMFWEHLSAGLCLRGLQLAIWGQGSDQTWSLDAGLLADIAGRWRCALAAHNINHGRLGRRRESLPQVLSMGLAYRPDARLLLTIDLREDIGQVPEESLPLGGYPVELRAGSEWHLWPPLALRLGLESSPTRFSAGAGFSLGPGHLDYAFRSHRYLGPTHHLSLSWP